MKRKLLSSFSIKKPQILGKLHIKKSKQTRGNTQMKTFSLLVKSSIVKNIRFMIASAAFTELFLNTDIYYTIYLMSPVHFSKDKCREKVESGHTTRWCQRWPSGLIIPIIKPIPCALLWCLLVDALTKSPIYYLYWFTFPSHYVWTLHVSVCWESPPEVSNSFYHLFSISHIRNGNCEVCP